MDRPRQRRRQESRALHCNEVLAKSLQNNDSSIVNVDRNQGMSEPQPEHFVNFACRQNCTIPPFLTTGRSKLFLN
eukprot:3290587-Amphidinium_carterae.1